MTMPIIPTDHLTAEEKLIANGIIATQGKNKGRLRAGKPKIEYTYEVKNGVRYRHSTLETGQKAYLWRMVAFHLSPVPAHQCLPMLAEFDLSGTLDEAKEQAKKLNELADKIVMAVPKENWAGIRRWAQALGY